MPMMRTLVALTLTALASAAVACPGPRNPHGSTVGLSTPTRAPFEPGAPAATPPGEEPPAPPEDDERPPPRTRPKPSDDDELEAGPPLPTEPPDDRPPPQPPVPPQQGGGRDPYDEMIGAFGANNNPDDNRPVVMDPYSLPGRPTGDDIRRGVDRPPYHGGGSRPHGGDDSHRPSSGHSQPTSPTTSAP